MIHNQLIKNLTKGERETVRQSLQFAHAIQGFIGRTGIIKSVFCERMGIKEEDYDAFVNGYYPYSERDKTRFSEYHQNTIES